MHIPHIPGSTMAYNAITWAPRLTMAASAVTLLFLTVSRVLGDIEEVAKQDGKPNVQDGKPNVLDRGAALTNLKGFNYYNAIGFGAAALSIAGLYFNYRK